VTIDPPAEDEHALVVDGASTAFGADSTVWVGLAGDVPTRVLGRVVDAWGDQFVGWITDAAGGRLGPAPAGARLGREIESELDSAAAFRAELADELELLRQAPGLPVESPGEAPRDLASLLGDRLDLAELCASLGLRQSEVMKLLRGKAPLTPDRIEVLARVTGLPAEKVASSVRPLPRGLVVTMEHPRWRQTWLARARRLEVSETEARLSAGYGAFAQAMRETGSGEPDWDERLRRYLHDEQSGTGSA
jgi:transcriptional regulator with XRE-family HTH domain